MLSAPIQTLLKVQSRRNASTQSSTRIPRQLVLVSGIEKKSVYFRNFRSSVNGKEDRLSLIPAQPAYTAYMFAFMCRHSSPFTFQHRSPHHSLPKKRINFANTHTCATHRQAACILTYMDAMKCLLCTRCEIRARCGHSIGTYIICTRNRVHIQRPKK